MSVKATMRDKRRYISFRIEASAPLGEDEVKKGLAGAVLSFIGEAGFARAGPRLIKFDSVAGFGELRCAADQVESVRSSLALLSSINGKKAAIRILGNSGSLKKLRKRRSEKAL
jgi:ribonuclease P/MRP protein subunit POP5